MVDATAADVGRWAEEIDRVRNRLGPRFARSEVRTRVGLYLRGLLAGVERKNGWQLAEFAGDLSPANVQHFIGRAAWDADAVRDDLRSYVTEHLGEPDGVLIVDETGFLKKGDKSVGVQRQYSGTAGRIENSQVGVFLAYKGTRGHALIDRALYLPKSWADDTPRRDEAHVPTAVAFATKPALARGMVERALEAGVPAAWVTADEVYGSDSKFRRLLEGRGVGYVLAVACSQRLFLGGRYGRADEHTEDLPVAAWVARSCGAGSKGGAGLRVGVRAVLAPDGSGPGPRVVGAPVAVGPGRAGLLPDACAGRGERGRPGACGWLAMGGRGVLRAGQGGMRAGPRRGPDMARVASPHHAVDVRARRPGGVAVAGRRNPRPGRKKLGRELIPLTVPEVRRLLVRVVLGWAHSIDQTLAFSTWRRRHQARAKHCHCRARGSPTQQMRL